VKSLVPGISVPHSGRCWINANFLELIQGGAASQEPYGKRVAEDHRRDPPHAHLFAALPDGILERFGGRHGTCCLSLLALRGLPHVPDQDAPAGTLDPRRSTPSFSGREEMPGDLRVPA
jgi:hypothetical protein